MGRAAPKVIRPLGCGECCGPNAQSVAGKLYSQDAAKRPGGDGAGLARPQTVGPIRRNHFDWRIRALCSKGSPSIDKAEQLQGVLRCLRQNAETWREAVTADNRLHAADSAASLPGADVSRKRTTNDMGDDRCG